MTAPVPLLQQPAYSVSSQSSRRGDETTYSTRSHVERVVSTEGPPPGSVNLKMALLLYCMHVCTENMPVLEAGGRDVGPW